PIGFSELDLGVDDILHVGPARIGEDAAVAEGSRAPFKPTLVPANHLSLLKRVDDTADETVVVLQVLVADTVLIEETFDVCLGMLLAEVGVFHDVLAGVAEEDRKSTRLNSSHVAISYA